METTQVVKANGAVRSVEWTGLPNRPAYHLLNARNHAMQDCRVRASTGLLAGVVIESFEPAVGGVVSTANRFDRVEIRGEGRTQYGFAHGQLKDGQVLYPEYDRNNEHMLYQHCAVYDTTAAAWLSYGSQSKEHLWTHCRAGTAYGGKGLVLGGGGGIWTGGAMYGFDVAFALGAPADPFTVIGGGYEKIKQLLVVDGPRREPYPVVLEGLRVMTQACDPDGRVPLVDFGGPGPLTIIGGQYGSGYQPIPTIRMRSWQGAPAVLRLQGVMFGAFGSYEARKSIVRYEGDCGLHVTWSDCVACDLAGTARLITDL